VVYFSGLLLCWLPAGHVAPLFQQASISIDDHASPAVVGVHTDKKENQILPTVYIMKFRVEQLQSHKRLMAFSYMVKYLRISAYVYYEGNEALPHI